ncbi:MAG: VIT1/CCC1 transporter family protein [Actinomycetota bacterium]
MAKVENGNAPFAKKYREFWTQERAAAWLYRELAGMTDDDQERATLEGLAMAEERHASHWEDLLRKTGHSDLTFKGPPLRERVMVWVAKRWGVEKVLPQLIRAEAADAGKYLDVAEAPNWMSEEEVQHGQTLAGLGRQQPARISQIEARHRVSRGGALRAATFGVNDGLVSNLSLVMGIAGGTGDPQIILLAGIAGLFAGAFSMGAGEWVSVRSQAELYAREIAIEEEELRLFPEEEQAELELIYRAKGVSPEEAKNLAARIMERPDVALDTLAREELGLDPGELGSPWVAAWASFLAFSFGAFVPVAPYLFATGDAALAASAIAAAAMLALVGGMISVLTGKSAWRSSLRMVLVGGAAASITYLVGNLVGRVVN